MIPGGMSDVTIPEYDPPPRRVWRPWLLGMVAVMVGFVLGWLIAGSSQ